MMKRGLLITAILFAVTLAVMIGLRLSTDALAVIIGVLFGIAASVPATLLLLFLMMRQQKQELPPPMTGYPPVVVINGQEKGPTYAPPALPSFTNGTGSRKWTVIGDEETGG